MDALLLIAVLFALIQVLLAGFAPLLTAFATGALIGAGAIAAGWRWGPLPGALWVGFVFIFLSRELIFDVLHPAENKALFSFSIAFVTLFSTVILIGIASTIQNYLRPPGQRRAPRFLPYTLALIAGLCIGAIVLTMSLRSQVDLTAGVSPETLASLPSVRARLLRYNLTEIHAKVGQVVTLRLDNSDTGVHSFDIDEFNVHAPMPVGKSGLAMFTPTKAGTYTYFCSVPGHEAVMNGKLIVEP